MEPSLTISELFSSGHSKKIATQVLEMVLSDHSLMSELMECFFSDDLRVCQRAAWPVGFLAERNSNLIDPYLKKMIDNLDTPHHNAVIRNTFRTFQFVDFSEELEGVIFNKAFDFLLDVNNAIAIRVFAMTVCGNIALKYPELGHELIPVIEENMPHGSAGFRSRGGSILRKLRTKS